MGIYSILVYVNPFVVSLSNHERSIPENFCSVTYLSLSLSEIAFFRPDYFAWSTRALFVFARFLR
jgi:hypothetical protein